MVDVVRINSPGDLAIALSRLLGFIPRRSICVICVHGERQRFGLVLRFDLELAAHPDALAAAIEARVRDQKADGVFVVVYADEPPGETGMPFADLVKPLGRRIGELMATMLLVVDDRWWAYLCEDPRCCPPEGTAIDPQSPGATSLAAAYALHGKAILASREAVVESLAYAGDPDAADRMRELIATAIAEQTECPRPARRAAVKELLSRLSAASHDPRSTVSDTDAATLVALCADVVVRDEVLIRAVKFRRRPTLLRVLTQVARQVPPPYDPPVCSLLAWVAYALGDGVVANVALDRALATDPRYSFARLIDDALSRQVPPTMLEEVMRDAARDLARMP